eukprot:3914604-Prymnesium_polylepis.1
MPLFPVRSDARTSRPAAHARPDHAAPPTHHAQSGLRATWPRQRPALTLQARGHALARMHHGRRAPSLSRSRAEWLRVTARASSPSPPPTHSLQAALP